MKTILLAAGYGKRLRPLTFSTPKCLIKINGSPLLGIWIEQLILNNFQPILVNTHYLSEKVEKFIKNNKYRNFIKIKNEKKLLGTAGTLLNNIEFIGNDDVCLIHADNYCLTDLSKFREAHQNRPKRCLMTMMIFNTKDPSSCGIVRLDNEDVVKNFYEKDDKFYGNLANAAIYIISNEMINEIKKNYPNANDFSTQIIPKYLDRIFAYKINEALTDIGTLKNYESITKKK